MANACVSKATRSISTQRLYRGLLSDPRSTAYAGWNRNVPSPSQMEQSMCPFRPRSGFPSQGSPVPARDLALVGGGRGGQLLPAKPRTSVSETLLCRGGKRRELAHVARVVLDDDRGLQVGGDLLDAVERGDRLRAVEVEGRHAVRLVVLVEVRRVAHEDDRALLLEPDEERAMARRVPGRAQHH